MPTSFGSEIYKKAISSEKQKNRYFPPERSNIDTRCYIIAVEELKQLKSILICITWLVEYVSVWGTVSNKGFSLKLNINHKSVEEEEDICHNYLQ